MRRLALLLLLSAACAPPAKQAPTPAALPTKPVSFSILEDYDKGDDLTEIARDFALFKELGITTWRGSFGWDDYEPEPGRYDFDWLHAFVRLAADSGIALRPYIGYTPAWAAQGGEDDQAWNDPPAELAAWTAFVDTLARALRRHPNVLSYEIYNEENVPLWWDGTVAEYNRVLAAGAAAIRRADPDARVLIGGLVWPDPAFMEETCADHGNAGAFDIASFHAYPETWTPDSVVVENYLDREYDEYLEVLAEACGGKPVWINETGYATTPGRSEREQAEWWARAIPTFLAAPAVEHIGVYEIKDLPAGEPIIGDAPNYHLGLAYPDRRKKLAFQTVDLLTDLLDVGELAIADAELRVDVVAGAAGELHHHLFVRPDGVQVLFVWDRTGSPTLDLTLARPGQRAISYELDGSASVFRGLDGRALRGVRLAPGRVRVFAIEP